MTRRIFILSIERTGERPLYIKEEKRGQSSQQEFSIIEISERFTSDVQFFIQGPFCQTEPSLSQNWILNAEFVRDCLMHLHWQRAKSLYRVTSEFVPNVRKTWDNFCSKFPCMGKFVMIANSTHVLSWNKYWKENRYCEHVILQTNSGCSFFRSM